MTCYGQPMSSVGDAFVVPFRDHRWAEGREELPPYGFPLARGMQLFMPLVGWGVIAVVI